MLGASPAMPSTFGCYATSEQQKAIYLANATVAADANEHRMAAIFFESLTKLGANDSSAICLQWDDETLSKAGYFALRDQMRVKSHFSKLRLILVPPPVGGSDFRRQK